MVINPFNKVYTAIWDLITADSAFTDLVAVRNCVRFDSEDDRQPIKETVQSADLPEVVLQLAEILINLRSTSSSSRFVLNFDLICNAGDYRLNEIAANLNWIVVCQLAKWCETLTAITWKGAPFVTQVSIDNARVGESDPRRNRGVKGWVTIFRVSVELNLKTSHLTVTE